MGATLALGGRSLKAQLKQGNALRLPQAIIIGEEEIKRGSVVLRDMMRWEQVELPLEEVVTRFRRRINQPRQAK